MYFSGPVMTYRTGFSPIVSPLKYTRFCKVREKKLMYFIFPNLGPLKYTRFCKVRKKKLVYFSGSLNMKILVLKDKNFHFLSPLKYIRFFKVREKKLMYFIFPNLGPLKYIRCEKMTLSTKVH